MSDCNVCIGGGDYDAWEFSSTSFQKARKPYKCSECNREIPKGITYERISGKCGGYSYIETFITCMDCVNIRNGLSCEGGGVGLGGLWEEITEVFSDVKSTACLAKIKTPSAKAYFLERWRKWKGLES